MGKKKKIKDSVPINDGAEYIILNFQDKKIYVDMRDIKEIKLTNQVVIMNGFQKPIYIVVFYDMTAWQIQDISPATLEAYNQFKERENKNERRKES